MVEDKTLYASSSEKMRQRGKKRKKPVFLKRRTGGIALQIGADFPF
jgi:hypothetical protein